MFAKYCANILFNSMIFIEIGTVLIEIHTSKHCIRLFLTYHYYSNLTYLTHGK